MKIADLLLRGLRGIRKGMSTYFRPGILVRTLVLLAGLVVLQARGAQLLGADNKIAMLVSGHTYDYFINAYEPYKCNEGDWNLGTHEYDRYYMGWDWMLKTAGEQYTVINDQDITTNNLRNFRILILSNNFWLDDSQTKIIADWVRGGGHLLATYGSGYAGEGGGFQKGGTNGLHELWGDPSAKLNSSFYYGNPTVNLRITQQGGPTSGFEVGEMVDYQWMANIFIQRPTSSRDINAFFIFDDKDSTRPAIFNNKYSKGLVVYYAFAPEYLISLANDLAGHCENDVRYLPENLYTLNVLKDLAAGLTPLMLRTLEYLK